MDQKQKNILFIVVAVLVVIVVVAVSSGKKETTGAGSVASGEEGAVQSTQTSESGDSDSKTYAAECLLKDGTIALGRATFDEDVDPNTAEEFELVNRNTGKAREINAENKNNCTFAEEQ